jgi:2-(1,2-epoxy-1,2-dihydrophenyl)acetyl-CoA isomerase
MSTDVVTSREGRIATIEINRPQTLNAIDFSMRAELLSAFEDLALSPEIGAVVLTGAGNAFSSGADLKSAASHPDTSVRRTARSLMHHFQPLIECITRMDKPVIAAVNGAAVGIGMSLALACDLLVMSDKAYLLSPFCGLGLIPDGGAAWFLTRRIGYARAFELLVEGQRLSASRCLELGLANRVVESSTLRETALRWAAEIAQRAPIAVALTKRVARISQSVGLAEVLTMEAELQTFCAGTEDAREAMAAFAEKRTPAFRGR